MRRVIHQVSRENITVSMPLEEYEALIEEGKFWQQRYNKLKRAILEHTDNKNSFYSINSHSEFVADIEEYLNSED